MPADLLLVILGARSLSPVSEAPHLGIMRDHSKEERKRDRLNDHVDVGVCSMVSVEDIFRRNGRAARS